MKQLKESTIKKYDVIQLCKHLDRYQDVNIDIDCEFLYLFDLQYLKIYKKGNDRHSYFFYCCINKYNREKIIEALNDIYNSNN